MQLLDFSDDHVLRRLVGPLAARDALALGTACSKLARIVLEDSALYWREHACMPLNALERVGAVGERAPCLTNVESRQCHAARRFAASAIAAAESFKARARPGSSSSSSGDASSSIGWRILDEVIGEGSGGRCERLRWFGAEVARRRALTDRFPLVTRTDG